MIPFASKHRVTFIKNTRKNALRETHCLSTIDRFTLKADLSFSSWRERERDPPPRETCPPFHCSPPPKKMNFYCIIQAGWEFGRFGVIFGVSAQPQFLLWMRTAKELSISKELRTTGEEVNGLHMGSVWAESLEENHQVLSNIFMTTHTHSQTYIGRARQASMMTRKVTTPDRWTCWHCPETDRESESRKQQRPLKQGHS